MPGFTRVDPSTVYSDGRGYGLKDAQIWRASDVLQPDPLYENFICHHAAAASPSICPTGGIMCSSTSTIPRASGANIRYYRQRTILAQGEPVVEESMTFDSLKNKYFRYWNTEDLPTRQHVRQISAAYYQEKEFDVDVKNGQLKLDFRGDGYACSVSAVVIYPVEKAEQGRQFLDSVVEKRRFFFDNYFHRDSARSDRRCARSHRRRQPARLRRLLARLHAGRLLQRHAAQGGNRPAGDRFRIRRAV